MPHIAARYASPGSFQAQQKLPLRPVPVGLLQTVVPSSPARVGAGESTVTGSRVRAEDIILMNASLWLVIFVSY